MTGPTSGESSPDAFEIGTDRAPVTSDETFVVDVDGFEGPLDLLLALARTQKVDLSRISILALADQYLAFIEEHLVITWQERCAPATQWKVMARVLR